MRSIPLLIIALFGVATAAPVVVVDTISADQVYDKSMPELSVAKAHLASTLSGGVYGQPAEPAEPSQEEGEANANFTNGRGGKGWVRIKRRRHLDY